MKIVKYFLVACVATALAASQVSAAVLYSDTFERVTGSGDGNGDPNGAADNFSDWGTNDNALGGSNSQAWVSGPNRAGGGRNAVTDGNLGISHGTGSLYEFDAAAASPDGFIVELDFSRFVIAPDPGPGAGGFISFALGVDGGTPVNEFTPTNLGDFAVLFQQTADGNAANANVFADGTSFANFDYLNPDTPHTLKVTVVPAASGAYGDTDTVNINVLVDGTISQNYSVSGGADFGMFSVGANNFDTRYIDNLVVSAIPEPTSLALAGLAVFAGFARRRR